jgi:hypothetical protein
MISASQTKNSIKNMSEFGLIRSKIYGDIWTDME